MSKVVKLRRTQKENLMGFLNELPDEMMDKSIFIIFPEDDDEPAHVISNFSPGREELMAMDALYGHMQEQYFIVEEE